MFRVQKQVHHHHTSPPERAIAKRSASKKTRTKPREPEKPPATSVNDVARHFRVGRRTVHEWFDRGCPRAVNGRYDLDAIAEWRAAHIRARPPEDGEAKTTKLDKWRIRNERQKALAGEEALRVTRGELVECDWVSRLLARHVSTHNAQLEALEDKVLGLLPAKLAAADRRRVKEGLVKVLADLRQQMAECVEEWHEELSERTSGQERDQETDPPTGGAG